MIPDNWFYKLMYRKRTIKLKAASGRNYIVEYHRTPFWTNEERTLKLFFKEKFNAWHGLFVVSEDCKTPMVIRNGKKIVNDRATYFRITWAPGEAPLIETEQFVGTFNGDEE